jgi:hypothetical protein
VAELISGLVGRPALGVSGSTGDGDRVAARRERSGAAAFLASLPPRASAVAVMSMLAFGVVVGSGASSLADTSGGPLLLAVSHPKGPTPATRVAAPVDNSASSGGSSSGGGNSGPTVVTQTIAAQTVTAPGGGSSSAPAPVHIPTTPSTTPTTPLPPVTHVFVIMLSGQGFVQLYGPQSSYPYLSGTLRPQGELLRNYYAVAPSPLANAIALVSGQGPTQQTAADCPQYSAVTPATPASGEQVTGDGCIYPPTALSLADQLSSTGQTWKAYVEGMTSGAPSGTPPTCRHPTVGGPDAAQAPRAGDPYVTWRNPFVYFQSIVTGPSCATEDVDLTQLASDLKSDSTTPALSYMVPTPCDDGSGQSCTPGQAADPQAAALATDAFLKQVVPEIEQSAAYKAGGLIAITSDQAPQTGPQADSSACCNNPAYPNLSTPPGGPSSTTTTTAAPTTTTGTTTTAAPTTTTGTTTTAAPTTTTGTTTTAAPTTTTGTTTASTATTTASPSTTTTGSSTTTSASTSAPAGNGQVTPTGGGGKVGLLLISPYVKPNSTDILDDYNHYSLLASIESLFTLSRLGYAADPSLPVFNSVVYNGYHPPGG